MAYTVFVAVSGDNRIARFRMDEDTGEMVETGSTDAAEGPAPLATDPEERFLFAALRGNSVLVSYRIDPEELALISKVPLETDACFVSTDRTGRFLFSAYYRGGMITVHPVSKDGELGESPVERIETKKNAHFMMTDTSNRFAYVPHTGPNTIFQFLFDEKSGKLSPNSPGQVSGFEKAETRHLAFHPALDMVYCSNEAGCSISAFRLDKSTGCLSLLQTESTLPDRFKGKNSCAQIRMTPDGRHVYVSNRGHDSIAGFSIDETTGRLSRLEQTPTEKVPRAFNIDPKGRFLLVAGRDTGNVATFRIDPDSGNLVPVETNAVGRTPMWVLFLSR